MTVDIKQLFEAGAHFGHKTSRWHPKMAPYIHSKRGGNHIIDLTKTVECLDKSLNFVKQIVAADKKILFVGTKKQAKDAIKKAAEDTNMPYVNERWIGGTLTNSNTIQGRIKHLKDLEANMQSGSLAAKYNKLELQRAQEEIDELNFKYGGIKELSSNPAAIFVADTIVDANAVREARKLGIPTIAIVDSNVDPESVDYPIPANDDALKSVSLIIDYITGAVNEGKTKAKQSS